MNYLRVDVPAVTQDQALELMAYHLQMAFAYSLNVSDDDAQVDEELRRLMVEPDMAHIKTYQSPAHQAAIPWLATVRAYDAKLKKQFEHIDKPPPEPDETVRRYLP